MQNTIQFSGWLTCNIVRRTWMQFYTTAAFGLKNYDAISSKKLQQQETFRFKNISKAMWIIFLVKTFKKSFTGKAILFKTFTRKLRLN